MERLNNTGLPSNLSALNRKELAEARQNASGKQGRSCALLHGFPKPGCATWVGTSVSGQPDFNHRHTISPVTKEESRRIIALCQRLASLNPEEQEAATISANLWESYAKLYEPMTAINTVNRDTYQRVAAALEGKLPDEARVLEIGAGNLPVSMALLERYGLGRFAELCAVEMQPAMLEMGRQMIANVFGPTDILRPINSRIETLGMEPRDRQFDAVISSLALPFLPNRESLVAALKIAHAKAKVGAAVVHVAHKDPWVTKAISNQYLKDVLLNGAHGGFWAGLREVLSVLPTVKALKAMSDLIAGGGMPCRYPTDEWISIMDQTGVTVTHTETIHAGQAELLIGTVK